MRAVLVLTFALLPLLVIPSACGINPSIGSGSGSDAAATGTPTATTAAACQGFRDISGVCLSVSCLAEAPCDASAPVPCYPGVRGDGVCFAGLCTYPNPAQGCGSSADCACGFCGADGRCYEDRAGGCGVCASKDTSGGTGGSSSGNNGDEACKSCMSSCQGTGPLCCSGAGCLCEGQCGGFI